MSSRRRSALLFLGVLFASAPFVAQGPSAEADRIFENYWQATLKVSPESATGVGDRRYNDRWSDYSGAAANAWLQQQREFLTALSALDPATLSPSQKLSSDLLQRRLIDAVEGARFKEWEMPVNQFNGPHTSIPQTVAQMPFDTVADYDNYIARLQKIPAVFAQVQESMLLGADEHRTPPRFLIAKVVDQVRAIAAAKVEDTPFLAPVRKFPVSVGATDQKRIATDAREAWLRQVQPAYDRFGRFLTAQYLPQTRTEPGASALPDGDAFYAYSVRQSTTLQLSAAEIHAIGEKEVERDEAEMLVIAKRLGFSDLKHMNAAIAATPKLHPTSPEQMVAVYQGYIDGMRAKLPQLFGRLPKAPLEVLPVPAYMAAQQAQAYYSGGTPDGARPGRVYVNTYHFAERGLENAESVSYHEGLPGHHLQISIAQELTGIPEFRKHLHYTAYVEGWGLYSERLGKDVGFYKDPYSDYGRLEADIWRAIRLVVDTGVHSQHWTRQQMVDYFHAHSGIDEPNVQAEVDRYIAWPAQALGYKMGQLKFIELRERAHTKLGDKFVLSDYHDLVIDSGALPLDVLEARVDAWIAAGGGKPKP